VVYPAGAPASSTDLENAWSYNSAPFIRLHGVCMVNFTFFVTTFLCRIYKKKVASYLWAKIRNENLSHTKEHWHLNHEIRWNDSALAEIWSFLVLYSQKKVNERFIYQRQGVCVWFVVQRERNNGNRLKKREERIVTKGFFADRVSIVSPSQQRYHGNRVIIDRERGRREVQNVKLETGMAKISPTTHL
jgi:hypothetical protein